MVAIVNDSESNHILGTVNGTTTVYIGGVFEYQAGATTTYYAGPNGPVALRRSGYSVNNGIFYLLGDHLGSTSVLLNQNGSVAKQEYYYPFGGNRGSAFSDITTKRFTGQYHESGLPGGEGLSYYNARWYDAQLGRFVSSDTIVPQPGNPQSLNRFSYVHNNALRYTDPTGHVLDQGGASSGPPPAPPALPGSSTFTGWNLPGFYYVYYHGFNPYNRGYNPYAATHAKRAGIPAKPQPVRNNIRDSWLGDLGLRGLESISMPPGIGRPDVRNGNLSSAFGIASTGADAVEALTAASAGAGLPDSVAIIDAMLAGIGSYFAGETGTAQLHSDLPPMFLVGQDLIVNGAEVVIGGGAKVALPLIGFAGSGGNPAGALFGLAAGEAVDVASSTLSFGYDASRVLGITPTKFSIGFYMDTTTQTRIPVLPWSGQPTMVFISYQD